MNCKFSRVSTTLQHVGHVKAQEKIWICACLKLVFYFSRQFFYLQNINKISTHVSLLTIRRQNKEVFYCKQNGLIMWVHKKIMQIAEIERHNSIVGAERSKSAPELHPEGRTSSERFAEWEAESVLGRCIRRSMQMVLSRASPQRNHGNRCSCV